jgi:hypothetical protein
MDQMGLGQVVRAIRIVRAFALCASASVVHAPVARTQSSSRAASLVSVTGLVYDSLGKRPLAGALVSLDASKRTTSTDENGRFRMDSVPVGARVFSVQHAAFDSAGLPGATVRAAVRAGMAPMLFAVPSFGTLWRGACGKMPVPAEGALVYGTVRDSRSLEVASDIAVDVTWSVMETSARRDRKGAVSDRKGAYAICGVPPNASLTVRTALEGSSVTSVERPPSNARVRRVDLLVQRPVAAAALLGGGGGEEAQTVVAVMRRAPAGTVVGLVTNSAGVPLPNVAVKVDTMPEVRTNSDGRFAVRDLAPGSRDVSIVAIGMLPYSSTVNVAINDTARLTIPMTSVQALEEVKVKARANTVYGVREITIEEHRRLGLGKVRDSTDIREHANLRTFFPNLGLTVRGKSAFQWTISAPPACAAMTVYLDNRLLLPAEVSTVDTQSLATVEVYTRLYPSDLIRPKGCTIVMWTKAGLGK